MRVVSGFSGQTLSNSGGEQTELSQTLSEICAADRGSLFVIIDAARGDEAMQHLATVENQFESLFRGTRAERDFANSPILATCREGTGLHEWLTTSAWGRSCAILVVSSASHLELVAHFRRLLLINTESGDELYFRFYDPRVLRTYLPTCTEAELSHIFGPASRLIAESEIGHELLSYQQNDPAAAKSKANAKPTTTLGKLIIRDAQMAVFAQRDKEMYVDRMTAYLQSKYSKQCEPLGEEGTKDLVKYGIQRAANYGINTEIAVREYLEIMMMYGRDFDIDPKHEWATRILSDPGFEHGKARADKLYEEGVGRQGAQSAATSESAEKS
jgi:hypothetical protein